MDNGIGPTFGGSAGSVGPQRTPAKYIETADVMPNLSIEGFSEAGDAAYMANGTDVGVESDAALAG